MGSKQFVSILTEPSAHLTGALALELLGPESFTSITKNDKANLSTDLSNCLSKLKSSGIFRAKLTQNWRRVDLIEQRHFFLLIAAVGAQKTGETNK